MYFKVTDNDMRSLYYDEYYGHGIQYEVGKMVRPTVGKIFVYSLEHLRGYGFHEYSFLPYNFKPPDRRLFICQCLFPKHMLVYVKQPACLRDVFIGKLFSKEMHSLTRSIVTRKVVLASGVKLIREVFRDEFQELIANRFQLLQAWRTRKS